jgi:dTDP-4-amino-4,6-dideoxygalactose transaminase
MIPINNPKYNILLSKKDIFKSFKKVIKSGQYILGEQVHLFEKEFAEFCEVPYAAAIGNGSDGLEIALVAVGVECGDEVITVANAGGYSSLACHRIGAKPIYIDVDENMLIDLNLVTSKITNKTKAIIVTHLYGQCVNIKFLKKILPDYIKIIEDCAQAHGSSFNGDKAGSMGDCGVFSFYPTKNLGTIGDAGIITTKNEKIYKKIINLRMYGWEEKFKIVLKNGKNSRMDEIHASILRVLLKKLNINNQIRKNIIKTYRDSAPSANWVGPLDNNCHHMCVLLEDNRESLIEHFKKNNIDTGIHYPILDYLQPIWYDKSVTLKKSEEFSKKVLTIPLYIGMSKKELNAICKALQEFYGTKVN